VRFDLGANLDVPRGGCPTEGDPDCHCTAVDILFIVDNSNSMQHNAAPTAAAFATFADEVVAALPPSTSVHVGLTRATGFFDPGTAGAYDFGTCEIPPGIVAQAGTWTPPTVRDNGVNGQQGRLYEHEGLRYFDFNTSEDPAALKTWFDGAIVAAIDAGDPFKGTIVLYSNSETVVASAAYPFHPANATVNAGFLREKAVLVLYLLSDSADLSPKNIPTSDFIQMVREAKAGCGDACVIPTGAIQGKCYDQPAVTNRRLYEFMNGFGHPPAPFASFAGGTPDLGGVLGKALAEVIGTACESIPPVG
jgi:hypothetical protein